MGQLRIVQTQKQPPRIVIYGPPKIGKSALGSHAPAPIYLCAEDGVDNIPVPKIDRGDGKHVPETWSQLLAMAQAVATEEHPYKTFVIDTLNAAVGTAAQHVCDAFYGGRWVAEKGVRSFNDYAQGWQATAEEIRKLLVACDAIRARGMTVLMLAHTGVANVKNPVEGDFQKYQADMDKRVWAVVSGWADVILRADFEYFVKSAAGDKRPGRAVGDSTRVLRTTGSAAEDAGCRVGYELPTDPIPMSWAELERHLGSDPETLAEVQRLWEVLSAEESAKAMAWLGVQTLADAQLTKLRELLNRLRIVAAQRSEEPADQNEEVANAA